MLPKELIYSNTYGLRDVIVDDYYKGVHYICVNIGDHPCAYFLSTKEFIDSHPDTYGGIKGIHVHGGVSHTGPFTNMAGLENYDGHWIGWDYGHAGDWTGHMSVEKNTKCGHRKYTTMMLITECKDAIKQYLNILDQDKEAEKKGLTDLTPEYLRSLGFQSVFNASISDSETTMHLSGKDGIENKWKIYIDFKNQSKSYVYNQNPRRKYEGAINTVKDLRMAVSLCQIPIVIN